jgi:hypothetical protein
VKLRRGRCGSGGQGSASKSARTGGRRRWGKMREGEGPFYTCARRAKRTEEGVPAQGGQATCVAGTRALCSEVAAGNDCGSGAGRQRPDARGAHADGAARAGPCREALGLARLALRGSGGHCTACTRAQREAVVVGLRLLAEQARQAADGSAAWELVAGRSSSGHRGWVQRWRAAASGNDA